MAAARPLVTVISDSDDKQQVKLPAVLVAPIRQDVVTFVHKNMIKNRRQAYAVSTTAGHQHSAGSWGTGRAVSRIPRVSGGGTHRAGQGAFGNMCRKGRMFAPTKVWRKWHRRINTNQRRYAVTSALAASAVPALVMARGHRIEEVEEVPLVVSGDVQSLTKTKEAVAFLQKIGAYADVEKVKESKKVRSGKGKMRNRRYVMRRGPLIVYDEDNGIVQAFRNLPGVELANVERLNLLQLAPGGNLGRFIIWTQPAFERLDEIYGTSTKFSQMKKGYKVPRSLVTNSDLARIINSDEIQSVVRPKERNTRRFKLKRNPLKNKYAMDKLNPYARENRRLEQEKQQERAERRSELVREKRAAKAQVRKDTAESKQNFVNNVLNSQ
jgi:large subunit ribosomal protein L4e